MGRFFRIFGRKKARPKPDGLFCTRSGIPPVRHLYHDCEGEQPEEENMFPISPNNQKKKIS